MQLHKALLILNAFIGDLAKTLTDPSSYTYDTHSCIGWEHIGA